MTAAETRGLAVDAVGRRPPRLDPVQHNHLAIAHPYILYPATGSECAKTPGGGVATWIWILNGGVLIVGLITGAGVALLCVVALNRGDDDEQSRPD
jgi:hypothetical protein